MEQISFYLGKFKNFGSKEVGIRTAVKSIISKQLKTDILNSQISVRQGQVFISVHPALKSELFLKKNKIEKELQSILGRMTEVR